MIEMRPEISGFYKGLIYCDNIAEAYQIADDLELILNKNIGSGLHAAVKRGCSEYAITFPEYKEINDSGDQLMNYNNEWKLIEKNHDVANPKKFNTTLWPTRSGLNLSDILIIQNWIDYAKGIGDQSVYLLKEDTIFSRSIHNIAKTRLKRYCWEPV